jgi:uncharacterized damage-inducible protein DinB
MYFCKKSNTMQQIKWFERKFNFDNSHLTFPSILERLEGAPLRLEHKLARFSEEILQKRIGETWTIKENAGHLIDLEPLWQGRLQDILDGKEILRPTDLANGATFLANHNDTATKDLIGKFYDFRQKTLGLLADIDASQLEQFGLHPRLKTPMRISDIFLFVAEHDDHHLARMTEIAKYL